MRLANKLRIAPNQKRLGNDQELWKHDKMPLDGIVAVSVPPKDPPCTVTHPAGEFQLTAESAIYGRSVTEEDLCSKGRCVDRRAAERLSDDVRERT